MPWSCSCCFKPFPTPDDTSRFGDQALFHCLALPASVAWAPAPQLPAVLWGMEWDYGGMGSSGAVTVPKTQPAVTLVILPWPWQLRPSSPKNPGKGDSWLYQESASCVQVPLGFPGPGIGHTGWARRAEKRTEPSLSLSVAFQIACIPVTISER